MLRLDEITHHAQGFSRFLSHGEERLAMSAVVALLIDSVAELTERVEQLERTNSSDVGKEGSGL